jgi:hypothetical protein
MKNIQPYIIAGMTILIVVLYWYVYSINSDIDIYKKQIELSKLKTDKKMVIHEIDSELNDLSKLSTTTVVKSKSILKKITHEIPKISDTTGVYMLEYVRNYRPKQ